MALSMTNRRQRKFSVIENYFASCLIILTWVYLAKTGNILTLLFKEFIKILGKCIELENIILSKETQSQNNTHVMHSLINGY
jgi:predicted nucleic acid-binding Zn ribbon protein